MEVKVVNGFFVVKTTVRGGTPYDVFSVWEPRRGRNFSTIMNIEFDGKLVGCGQVGTEGLPSELDKLPAMSEERYEAVTSWRLAQYDFAYDIIRQSGFDVSGKTEDCGELR